MAYNRQYFETWEVYPGEDYDEYLFTQPQDLDDKDLNSAVCAELGCTEDQIDWRDDCTLWVWHQINESPCSRWET